jgi:hypothetical protein
MSTLRFASFASFWCRLLACAAVVACGHSGNAKSPVASGDGTMATLAAPSSTANEAVMGDDAGTPAGPRRSEEPGRRREDIQAMMQSRRDEVRACYDMGLKNHPGIEGDLVIKWTIDPQGLVTDIEVDTPRSQFAADSVSHCIIDIIKKIKFAPSAKGFETRAYYPFNFRPRTSTGVDAGR